jgi:cytochrome c oxidase subunit 2
MEMNKGVLLVAALVIVAAIGFFTFSSFSSMTSNVTDVDSSKNTNAGNTATIKIINIDATRWQYDRSTITVKKGEHIKIIINNVDTKHGIIIPELGVSGIESVDFVADKTGTFEFKCPTFCGEGHKSMTGTLIVTE